MNVDKKFRVPLGLFSISYCFCYCFVKCKIVQNKDHSTYSSPSPSDGPNECVVRNIDILSNDRRGSHGWWSQGEGRRHSQQTDVIIHSSLVVLRVDEPLSTVVNAAAAAGVGWPNTSTVSIHRRATAEKSGIVNVDYKYTGLWQVSNIIVQNGCRPPWRVWILVIWKLIALGEASAAAVYRQSGHLPCYMFTTKRDIPFRL